MSLLYDEGQQAIATESRRVVEARILPEKALELLERQGEFDPAFQDMAVEQGWTGLAIPEEFDGLGLSLVDLGIIALQCGAFVSGAPFITSSYGVSRALLASDSGALKSAWLPRLASGAAIGAVAFAEGQTPLPARAQLTFANGRLNGIKPAVSAGSQAHVAVVLASDGGTPVLAIADLSGCERCLFNSFDNSRCTADIVFADSPAEVIASGDAAMAAALDVLAAQSVVTAHEQTGGAEALMLRARDYANTRRAFGQPIGAFQSVKHKIAELYGMVELARANAIHAASRDGESDFIKAAAAARISATEAYDTAARDCVQVHGGIGVTWEAGLHLHMRRTRTLAIEQGNLLFWEDVLASELTGVTA